MIRQKDGHFEKSLFDFLSVASLLWSLDTPGSCTRVTVSHCGQNPQPWTWEIQLSQLALESEPNRPVTMEEIEKVFETLPSPKTPGPDGVSG